MMYKVLGHDQKVYGPVGAAQIRQWQAEGRVNAGTLLLADGATEWRPLSAFAEFGTPPVMQAPPPARGAQGNDMATAGFAFGLLSNICCCFGGICGILGIVFSIIALTRSEADPTRGGKGLALAGLILSVLGVSWRLILPFYVFGMYPHHAFHIVRHWHLP
jgi:hypothetical protein